MVEKCGVKVFAWEMVAALGSFKCECSRGGITVKGNSLLERRQRRAVAVKQEWTMFVTQNTLGRNQGAKTQLGIKH
jgi:hypothetical protein